jgi:lysophospholipase L1-like esterase
VRTGVTSLVSARSRILLFAVILLAELAVLEAGLRWYGGSEASPGFQSLFMNDPAVGHRLRPNARTTYTTTEFSTDLAINAQGVRDDKPIGPKAPGERRVLVLGDSMVLAVQVPLEQTFVRRLENRLNAQAQGAGATRWRVINGGVQGYGPVNEWLFFDKVAAAFEPDLVVLEVFVGNDAIEALPLKSWLADGPPPPAAGAATLGAVRRFVRSTLVWQTVRVRWDQLKSRFTTSIPEPPLAMYLETPPPYVAEGLDVAKEAVQRIATRAAGIGARTVLVLVPAKFQVNDLDFEWLDADVTRAGGRLARHSATERVTKSLAPLGLPMLDLLPVFQRQPHAEGLFWLRNVHLTARGHEVFEAALYDFLQANGLLSPR